MIKDDFENIKRINSKKSLRIMRILSDNPIELHSLILA